MAEIKHCASCRFMAAARDERWDEDVNDMVEYTRHTCVRIIHGNANGDHHIEPTEAQRAIVIDGSGYAARLLVLPTFGCVLHEERETTKKTHGE